jgi:ribosomal-protein-alanine N-acetyltransferase
MIEQLGIDKANHAHVPKIIELEQICFSSPWPPELIYEDICINNNIYYVLKLQDEMIGYAGMSVIIDEAHLTNVCVHPDYRAQGFGKWFMQKMIEIAVSEGAQSMTLEVRVSNAAAIEMYKDLGFSVEGVRKKYYNDNREDAYIMWKHGL